MSTAATCGLLPLRSQPLSLAALCAWGGQAPPALGRDMGLRRGRGSSLRSRQCFSLPRAVLRVQDPPWAQPALSAQTPAFPLSGLRISATPSVALPRPPPSWDETSLCVPCSCPHGWVEVPSALRHPRFIIPWRLCHVLKRKNIKRLRTQALETVCAGPSPGPSSSQGPVLSKLLHLSESAS